MAEITQKLGFEASGAIATITEMTEALKGLNKALGGFNKTAGQNNQSKVVQGFAQVDAGAKKAASAVEKLGNKTKEAGQKGSKAAKEFTISWGGLVKALVARTAVQAITATIGALKNATDAAAEFQITVAQISNIAKGSSGTIEALTESLGNLSVSIGRDIGEVSEAAFEALQNDLGTTEETMKLLEGAANNLALVTGGTLTQAVNSISSVIKAYGIDISEADSISDTFFQAIDSGRITLEEFQSSLGRIAPLASVLGVSFEETAAAIATITQSGTSGATANTQLRNVLQKMLDPTEKLSEAFKQLGFSTGQQLIAATGGLIPALQKLSTVAEVGSQEFADFFGTIRGNLGSLNLLNNEGENFNKIFAAMANKANRAAEGAKAIEGVDARDAAKSMEELNRTFRDLGNDLLKVKNVAITAFNSVIGGAAEAKIVLVTLGATFAALATSASIAAGGLLIAFAPITASIIAIGVAVGATVLALKNLYDTFIAGESASARSLRALNEFEEAQQKIADAQSAEQFKENQKEQADAVKEFTESASSDYQKLANKVKETQSDIKDALDNTFDKFTSDIEKAVNGASKNLDKMAASAKQFGEDAKNIGKEIEDAKFDENLKTMTKQQQVNAVNLKLQKAQKDVLDKASKVDGSKETQDGLKQAIKDAETLADRLSNLSKGNGFNERKAQEATQKNLVNNQKANLKAQDVLNKKVADGRKAATKQEEDDALKVAKLSQKLKEEKVGTKEFQNVEQQLREAIANVDTSKLQEKTKASFEASVRDFQSNLDRLKIKFDDAAASLQASLNANGPFSAQIAFGDKLGSTGNQPLDQTLANIDENVQDPGQRAEQKLKANQEFLAQQRDSIANEEKLAIEAAKITQQLRVQKEQLASAGRQTGVFEKDRIAGQEVLQQINEIQSKVDGASNLEGASSVVNEIRQGITASNDLTEAQKAAGIASLSNIDQLIAKQKQLNDFRSGDQAPDAEGAAQAEQNIAEALQTAAVATEKAKEGAAQFATETSKAETSTKATALSATQVSQNLGLLAPIMQNVSTDMGTTATNAGTASTNTGNIATAMGSVISQTGAAVSAMGQLAQAAAAAARAVAAANQAASSSGAKYHGGKIAFRAQGGPTRGQDTQLTATSPGEVITNARSSRQFFSQLQSINAGQSPQQRDKGGTVTNVGDINVSVSSDSSSPNQVGQAIGTELRRQVRRQTFKF